jgi:hypothetical protein
LSSNFILAKFVFVLKIQGADNCVCTFSRASATVQLCMRYSLKILGWIFFVENSFCRKFFSSKFREKKFQNPFIRFTSRNYFFDFSTGKIFDQENFRRKKSVPKFSVSTETLFYLTHKKLYVVCFFLNINQD